ncbi:glucose-1-phosphate cytidylyltransferase [Ferrovibrio sp.]|uniref:glucose-1-phosphate cytidylyltransferase n=2 Tax=Ferrovibrio sp. TaxID=1917215 RepID=UPI0035B0A8BB
MSGPAASKIAEMECVILCGGLGTRLREETEFKPKPMVEIGGRPILWHIMRHYSSFGVRNFVLCLGYKGEVIRDYFLNYRFRNADVAVTLADNNIEILGQTNVDDWRVVLADTGPETQTGGRIKRAIKHVRGKRFFATYGDGVSNVDIATLLDVHEKRGLEATVTAVHPSSRYGEIDIQEGTVHTFQEKPQVGQGWINGGFFVFERPVFERASDNPKMVLETDILPPLAQSRQLAAHHHDGFWQCMDTFREMQMLNEMWQSGRAPWLR